MPSCTRRGSPGEPDCSAEHVLPALQVALGGLEFARSRLLGDPYAVLLAL